MKIDFSQRHPGPELMDGENIPEKDLYRNYSELHTINKFLGGYSITINGLNQLLTSQKEISILDIGCGGGDMLKQISIWGRRKNIKLKLTGIDLSAAAINYSKLNCKSIREINFIQADVFEHLKNSKRYDVITTTLFLHHFTNEEIVQLLSLMNEKSNIGIVINDLQRNAIAYRSIQLITSIFSKSYLVKNDAPLSVARGFFKKELAAIANEAKVNLQFCKWMWAFRYLLVIKK